jgi:hypothetical protein
MGWFHSRVQLSQKKRNKTVPSSVRFGSKVEWNGSISIDKFLQISPKYHKFHLNITNSCKFHQKISQIPNFTKNWPCRLSMAAVPAACPAPPPTAACPGALARRRLPARRCLPGRRRSAAFPPPAAACPGAAARRRRPPAATHPLSRPPLARVHSASSAEIFLFLEPLRSIPFSN